MRIAVGLVVITAGILFCGASPLAAQDPTDGPVAPGGSTGVHVLDPGVALPEEDTPATGSPDKTVSVEADIELPAGDDAEAAAAPTPEPTPVPGTVAASDGGTFVGRRAARAHPGGEPEPCLELEYGITDENGVYRPWSFPVCIGGKLDCGAERIDSLYSGRLSGTTATGAYADYLTQIATGAVSGGAPVVDFDIDATSTSIISAGLGDEPSPHALPVFNWCRQQDDPQLFVTNHPQYGVSFTWTADVFAEYPVPRTLDNLYQKVRADIGLYKPDIATIPPVERAATIIKFPTWLWVNNPYDGIEASATSDINHIRVEVRANLDHIEWHLGDHTLNCTPTQMTPYIDGNDPFDAPDCHHIFTELTTFDFAATLHYTIEQRVTRRLYEAHPWPTLAWTPHTTNPTVELTTTIGPYAVRELRAVNVSEETTG